MCKVVRSRDSGRPPLRLEAAPRLDIDRCVTSSFVSTFNEGRTDPLTGGGHLLLPPPRSKNSSFFVGRADGLLLLLQLQLRPLPDLVPLRDSERLPLRLEADLRLDRCLSSLRSPTAGGAGNPPLVTGLRRYCIVFVKITVFCIVFASIL